jgi:hypothetical protein
MGDLIQTFKLRVIVHFPAYCLMMHIEKAPRNLANRLLSDICLISAGDGA